MVASGRDHSNEVELRFGSPLYPTSVGLPSRDQSGIQRLSLSEVDVYPTRRRTVAKIALHPSWREAQRIADDTLKSFDPEIAESRAARQKSEGQRRTVSEACDLWIARTKREFSISLVAQYQSLCKQLKEWATGQGIVHVQDITTERLERWYSSSDWLRFADTTRRQRWGVLRSMFAYWRDRKIIDQSPIAPIKPVRVSADHVQGPYSDEQVASILAAVGKTVPMNIKPEERGDYAIRLTTFLNLLLHIGCDLSDGILFEPSQISVTEIDGQDVHVFRYRRRKTGVLAVIPVPRWLADDLLFVPPLKKHRSGLPFRTQTEADLRWDVRVWFGRIQRVLKKADVQYVLLPTRDAHGRQRRKSANAKMFRHTFAVRQLRAGQRPEEVARMLGHVDTTMVLKHYAPWVKDLDEAHVRRVVASWTK
jgi:integrase